VTFMVVRILLDFDGKISSFCVCPLYILAMILVSCAELVPLLLHLVFDFKFFSTSSWPGLSWGLRASLFNVRQSLSGYSSEIMLATRCLSLWPWSCCVRT
jgi:hypothetical protein